MKKKTPANIVYDTTGELPNMFFDWPAIIGDCRNAILQETKYVIAPVSQPVGTKKNKSRMDKDDKTSPLGLIMKEIKNYHPYAAARFDPEEVAKWAVQRFLALSEEEQGQFMEAEIEDESSP